MTFDIQTRRVLDEDEVRRIAKSIRTFVPSGAATGEVNTDDQLKAFRLLLENVFFTCAASGITAAHRVAAWNTLCSLIDQAVDSSVSETKDLVWTGHVWERAFSLYLSHAQSARPKSLRQLLITLTNALRKHGDRDLEVHKDQATERLVRCLLDYESPYAAKVSKQLLGHLLIKNVVTLQQILAVFNRCRSTSTNGNSTTGPDVTRDFEDLLETVFRWLSKGDFGSTVAQILTVLLDNANSLPAANGGAANTVSRGPIWARPLQSALLGNAADVDTLRAHILPVLFKRDFGDFVSFLEAQGLISILHSNTATTETDEQMRRELLCAALQTGKELGFLDETDGMGLIRDASTSTLYFPRRAIGNLLFSASRMERLTGLSLLITSPAATRPFLPASLMLIKKAFAVFFADVDADFRSAVFSAFQRLVDRVRSIAAVLARQSSFPSGTAGNHRATENDSLIHKLMKHKGFLQWLVRFLASELRPTASYQRHISALKCLSILTRSGLDSSVSTDRLSRTALGETKWPFHMALVDIHMRRLLLDLVANPFDDVRQMSSNILSLYCSSKNGLQHPELKAALDRTETIMLRTGRADQADGVAHLYSLLYQSSSRVLPDSDDSASLGEVLVRHLMSKVEEMIVIAKQNLAGAVQSYPIHGLLTSIRYVLAQGNTNQHAVHIFEDLKQVWNVVKPVLCNDAPEGYQPDELEESSDTTKETLSYCWRALKEASLLSSVLVSDQPVTQGGSKSDFLQQMSDECFTQLAELRHRGAFSTVAQTWIVCCIRCKDLTMPDGNLLLEQWYARVIEMLRNNITINTRRSAGLPSLLCGILIADRSGKMLSKAYEDIEGIARQEVDPDSAEEGSLAQVHAMNCLKDVLKNTRLGEQSEKYVPASLRLAAHALQSEVWAIRNCGLMLFRAVIDRLLGTDQSHFEEDASSSKHISIEEHPELLDVILGLLPRAEDAVLQASTRYEGVFPALQLLQHTRVPVGRLDEVKAAVTVLIACPVWHVRDKASRTLASLIIKKDNLPSCAAEISDLFNFSSEPSQNHLHGTLLTVKHAVIGIRRHLEQSRRTGHTYLYVAYELVREAFEIYTSLCRCLVNEAACLDVARECSGLITPSIHSLNNADLGPIRYRRTAGEQAMPLFQKLLSRCRQAPNAAVIRQATARFIAQQISSNDLHDLSGDTDIAALLTEFAQNDENACGDLLKALDPERIVGGQSDSIFYVPEFIDQLLKSHLSAELKCEAQRLHLIARFDERAGLVPIRQSFSRKCLAMYGCTQRLADQALQMQADYLEGGGAVLFSGMSTAEELEADISDWAETCAAAVDGTGIHSREAAVEALNRILVLWYRLAEENRLEASFRRLCIAVCDLLNDDDEDVRLLAAQVASRAMMAIEGRSLDAALNHSEAVLEPIVASQKLLRLCVRRWNQSTDMAAVAMQRAFDISESRPTSVAEQLASLSRSDTALFAEEKQNLYIDDAREVRSWSQVVQRLSPSAISKKRVSNLAIWVDEGLNALKQQAQIKDGPLGWSTKADVFTLGLKVVYGAEVFLGLGKQGVRIPARPSSLRRKLFDLATAFESSDVNGLWQSEIHRILAGSVLDKIRLVHGLMHTIDPYSSEDK